MYRLLHYRFSEMDSFTHTTFSADIKLVEALPFDDFKSATLHAMVRLRHLAPGVACTTSRLPSSEFQFKYAVLKSTYDAMAWANKVVFVQEEPESFSTFHARLADTRFWKGSDGRSTVEVHIAPSPTCTRSWTLS